MKGTNAVEHYNFVTQLRVNINIIIRGNMQGRSDDTSIVAFEVLVNNYQACFKDFFSFNCLTSNFCFPQRYIRRRQKRANVTYVRPYFRLLKSTGKMMTCSRHNQIKF